MNVTREGVSFSLRFWLFELLCTPAILWLWICSAIIPRCRFQVTLEELEINRDV